MYYSLYMVYLRDNFVRQLLRHPAAFFLGTEWLAVQAGPTPDQLTIVCAGEELA